MVKCNIISPTKANRLFWLGRYVERVYMTLHILRKCYDRMIDGEPSDYELLKSKLDPSQTYKETADFTIGMLYDEGNKSSIISSLKFAFDNAILLREDITSESLSFIEMSIAFIKKCKSDNVMNITYLQNITDWMLSFWGSCEERITNHGELSVIMVGKSIEKMDLSLRFNYPFNTIDLIYTKLNGIDAGLRDLLFDSIVEKRLDDSIRKYRVLSNGLSIDYGDEILRELNQLVKV